jgi:hypothetical protein
LRALTGDVINDVLLAIVVVRKFFLNFAGDKVLKQVSLPRSGGP